MVSLEKYVMFWKIFVANREIMHYNIRVRSQFRTICYRRGRNLSSVASYIGFLKGDVQMSKSLMVVFG